MLLFILLALLVSAVVGIHERDMIRTKRQTMREVTVIETNGGGGGGGRYGPGNYGNNGGGQYGGQGGGNYGGGHRHHHGGQYGPGGGGPVVEKTVVIENTMPGGGGGIGGGIGGGQVGIGGGQFGGQVGTGGGQFGGGNRYGGNIGNIAPPVPFVQPPTTIVQETVITQPGGGGGRRYGKRQSGFVGGTGGHHHRNQGGFGPGGMQPGMGGGVQETKVITQTGNVVDVKDTKRLPDGTTVFTEKTVVRGRRQAVDAQHSKGKPVVVDRKPSADAKRPKRQTKPVAVDDRRAVGSPGTGTNKKPVGSSTSNKRPKRQFQETKVITKEFVPGGVVKHIDKVESTPFGSRRVHVDKFEPGFGGGGHHHHGGWGGGGGGGGWNGGGGGWGGGRYGGG